VRWKICFTGVVPWQPKNPERGPTRVAN